MSRTRTERLVNLVICLLSTRRFLTAAQIAATVPGYEHDPEDPRDHEAFQRKFERDKAELRELGVPLETGLASAFDTEHGYRIAHREYALPDIPLEPDEAAAVGIAARLWQHAGLAAAADRPRASCPRIAHREYALPDIPLETDEAAAVGIAARLWQHAGLAAAASSGLAKLRAAGVEVDPQATLGVEPVVTVDPAFGPLTGAARSRRAVTFSYRTPEGDDPTTRRLEPWGVVCWQGRWYVVGHDRDRRATRCFRLSRIVGSVRAVGSEGAFTPPEKVDLISHVARWSGPVTHTGRATVLARPGRAAGLRRWALETSPGPEVDRLTVPYSDVERLASTLVGYGADVRVEGPPELREAVIQQLKEVVARHEPLATAVST